MGELFGYLLDAIFLIMAVRVLYALLRRFFTPRASQQRSGTVSADSPSGGSGVQMVRDPECGTFVSTELSHRLRKGGETLHFCSEDCLEKYRAHAA